MLAGSRGPGEADAELKRVLCMYMQRVGADGGVPLRDLGGRPTMIASRGGRLHATAWRGMLMLNDSLLT